MPIHRTPAPPGPAFGGPSVDRVPDPACAPPSVRLVVRVAVPPPPRHRSGPGSPERPDAAPGAWSPTTSTSGVHLDSWRHQPVAAGGDSWPLDTRFVTDPSFAAGVLDSWQGRMIEVSE